VNAVAEEKPEPWSEPSAAPAVPSSEPEAAIAATAAPEPEAPASQDGPVQAAEPEAEPAAPPAEREIAAATRPPVPAPSPSVTSTLVGWPTGAAAATGNGRQGATDGFEEATSIIPAWQNSPADSKGTVSLRALPPEELAHGAGYAALLTFESGPFAGRIVALPSQMVSIGRAPDNDVVVGDPATSGHHGRIEVRNGSFWISDLGSTNGTLVNGEPVIEKQLSDGDLVSVGQSTIRFTLES
jgi:pSer/pThr/pTyr-binding forkhead associated (FHA) protein